MRPINPEDKTQPHLVVSTNGEDLAVYAISDDAVVGRLFITKSELRALSNYIDQ